jgi:hypothetical protein
VSIFDRMVRVAFALATVGAASSFAAPAAHAAIYPDPLVASPHTTAPAMTDGPCGWKLVSEAMWHVCGMGLIYNLMPSVVVAPGEPVTFRLPAADPGVAVDGFTYRINDGPLTPADPNAAQSITVPADLPLPATLTFEIDAHDDTTMWAGHAGVNLVPVPGPAPQTTPAPAAAVTLSSAKLKGRKLSVTATCGAAQGCDGTFTLSSSHLRVARVDVGTIAHGATKTFKTTVSASRVRLLARHHVKVLRAVITPAKGVPGVSQLELARA